MGGIVSVSYTPSSETRIAGFMEVVMMTTGNELLDMCYEDYW